MKIQLISDVHGRFGKIEIAPEVDVIVAAGDIAERNEGVDWLISLKKPVIYVLGNHEYYGGEMMSVQDSIRRSCAGTNVRFLENDTAEFEDVRFIGTTLWSDFGGWNPILVKSCLRCMNDYRQVSVAGWASDEARSRLLRMVKKNLGDMSPSNGLFHPVIAARLHKQAKRFLEQTLTDEWDGKNFVVTHHAPSYRSLRHAGYSSVCDPKTWTEENASRGAKLYKAGAYASNLEGLISETRPDFWVHGHLHEGVEYPCHGTRVSTNPLGYWDGQNPKWTKALIIDTDEGNAETVVTSVRHILSKQRQLVDKIDSPNKPINFFSSFKSLVQYGQTAQKFDELTMRMLSTIRENIPLGAISPPTGIIFISERMKKEGITDYENISGFERERVGKKIVNHMKDVLETFENWTLAHSSSWVLALKRVPRNKDFPR